MAAIDAAGSEAAAQAPPASAQTWDLRWMDELKAQHKQVFDLGRSGSRGRRPSRCAFRGTTWTRSATCTGSNSQTVKTIVGISGRAFPINACDRLWEKYALGERSKIIDPVTMKPAVRNVFMDDSTMGVKSLQARGTIFWQCNIALTNIAQQLAAPRQLSAAEVRADLLAGLNPGVRLVPSHVMAMGLVQERGVTYVKI